MDPGKAAETELQQRQAWLGLGHGLGLGLCGPAEWEVCSCPVLAGVGCWVSEPFVCMFVRRQCLSTSLRRATVRVGWPLFTGLSMAPCKHASTVTQVVCHTAAVLVVVAAG